MDTALKCRNSSAGLGRTGFLAKLVASRSPPITSLVKYCPNLSSLLWDIPGVQCREVSANEPNGRRRRHLCLLCRAGGRTARTERTRPHTLQWLQPRNCLRPTKSTSAHAPRPTLLVLGVVRLLSAKGLDYAEHLGRYQGWRLKVILVYTALPLSAACKPLKTECSRSANEKFDYIRH